MSYQYRASSPKICSMQNEIIFITECLGGIGGKTTHPWASSTLIYLSNVTIYTDSSVWQDPVTVYDYSYIYPTANMGYTYKCICSTKITTGSPVQKKKSLYYTKSFKHNDAHFHPHDNDQNMTTPRFYIMKSQKTEPCPEYDISRSRCNQTTHRWWL